MRATLTVFIDFTVSSDTVERVSSRISVRERRKIEGAVVPLI